MIKSIEARIDTNGEVRLLEPFKVNHACRAIVTIIDGPGAPEAALLSQEALARDWDRPEEDAAWSHLQ